MSKKTKTSQPKEKVQLLYTIEEVIMEDGTVALRRTAHGIDSHRLHSILMFAANDVARQIVRDLPPPQRIYKDR